MNIVCLSGYLAQDPAMVGSDERAMCRLRVAINNWRRAQDGSWKEDTSFFDVYVAGKQATAVMNKAHKGAFCAVSGHLVTGKNGRGVFIRADRVQIVPRQPSSQPQGDAPEEEEVEIPF